MFSEELLKKAADCEKALAGLFAEIDKTAFANTQKVMKAFADNRLSERHFNPTCGYGYNDDGRDMCDRLFSCVFGKEAGFARANIISGTHALTIALFGLLRTGDTLLSVSGKPYDTLDGVIGIKGANGEGSLADYGIKYAEIPLVESKTLDLPAISDRLKTDNTVRVVFVQRSKGYGERRTLTVSEIDELYALVHGFDNVYLVVDNCYGEFCEEKEPRGDLLVGSLIKNPGGGIAETGGYLVGSERAVELASYRLTVAGIGLEAGASMGTTKPMIKGLFFAPHITAQALKTAHFAAAMLESCGFECFPVSSERRSDRVVMAAGAFTQGSSIELSADAPLREPYTVYMQGGLTYESGKFGILTAISEMEHKQPQ